jgi:hypothetical protein
MWVNTHLWSASLRQHTHAVGQKSPLPEAPAQLYPSPAKDSVRGCPGGPLHWARLQRRSSRKKSGIQGLNDVEEPCAVLNKYKLGILQSTWRRSRGALPERELKLRRLHNKVDRLYAGRGRNRTRKSLLLDVSVDPLRHSSLGKAKSFGGGMQLVWMRVWQQLFDLDSTAQQLISYRTKSNNRNTASAYMSHKLRAWDSPVKV